jgi:hypothetical protein
MIRILLGSALPVLGIGAAATFLSPDLLTAPRGEPLVMVMPGDATLHSANYVGDACASTLLFADPSGDPRAPTRAGTRIVAFALPTGPDDVAVAVEDFPRAPAEPRTVVLVFDEAGQLVSAGDANSLDVQAAAGLADCINPPAPDVHAPI